MALSKMHMCFLEEGAPLTRDADMGCHFSSEKRDRSRQGEIPLKSELVLWETPLLFLSRHPHPCSQNWLCLSLTPEGSLSQEKKRCSLAMQILLCVLRKSLALSEPEIPISS